MKPPLRTAFLTPYSQTFNHFVDTIEAQLSCDKSKTLNLVYRLKGNMAQLRVPESSLSRRVDGLWQHTCFEAFVKTSAAPNYWEFNFSPSGEWAAYSFRSYRDGASLVDESFDPMISVQRTNNSLALGAVVALHRLPALMPGQLLRLGLSAVVEAIDGKLSYWALKHPAERPDFHHADSFVLEFALRE